MVLQCMLVKRKENKGGEGGGGSILWAMAKGQTPSRAVSGQKPASLPEITQVTRSPAIGLDPLKT